MPSKVESSGETLACSKWFLPGAIDTKRPFVEARGCKLTNGSPLGEIVGACPALSIPTGGYIKKPPHIGRENPTTILKGKPSKAHGRPGTNRLGALEPPTYFEVSDVLPRGESTNLRYGAKPQFPQECFAEST